MPKDSEKKPTRVRVEVIEEEKHPSGEITESNDDNKDTKVADDVKPEKTVEEFKLQPEMKESGPKSDKIPIWILFLAFLIGLLLGAGLIGGVFYYRSHLGDESIPPKIENEDSDIVYEETTTPEPKVEIDYSKYTINILNGSGIKGEAAKVEELLKDLNFKSIDTGNADSYEFAETEIALKEGLSETIFTDLEKALSTYSVKKVDNLESSSNYDIQITVGQKKN